MSANADDVGRSHASFWRASWEGGSGEGLGIEQTSPIADASRRLAGKWLAELGTGAGRRLANWETGPLGGRLEAGNVGLVVSIWEAYWQRRRSRLLATQAMNTLTNIFLPFTIKAHEGITQFKKFSPE